MSPGGTSGTGGASEAGAGVGGHGGAPGAVHQGRYKIVSAGSWLSITPADNRRIEHRLADVVAAAA